jgi:hypothetical protein
MGPFEVMVMELCGTRMCEKMVTTVLLKGYKITNR